MNRYDGNTGRVEHIPEPNMTMSAVTPAETQFGRAEYKKPSGVTGVLDGLGGILSRIMKSVPEIEDFLLIAVMYLLYRESGDIEFLLIAGIMLFM